MGSFISSIGFAGGRAAGKKTLYLIVLALLAVIVSVTLELYFRRPAIDARFLVAGIVILAIGFAIRTTGYINLGRQFTLEVKRVPHHKIVTTGIHSYIRHPMYTGLFLIVVGLCVMLQSIAGMIATLIVFVPVGIYRMKVEEEFLTREFGREYRNYAKKTKKLIPLIW